VNGGAGGAAGWSTGGMAGIGGSAAGGPAANAIKGTWGNDQLAPVVSALWIGMPSNPAQSGGGPVVYLFSAPVTCDMLSQSNWPGMFESSKQGNQVTQVTSLIIGTTMAGVSVPVAAWPAPNAVQAMIVALSFSGSASDTYATGSVSLTSYVDGVSVDGTVDLSRDWGDEKGTFHAVFCPTGKSPSW
jgi:hypothetical protein